MLFCLGVRTIRVRLSPLPLPSSSSLRPKDDNKVFGVTFRTPPSNSRGMAHILEHSVLCGSRQYPTKEPFVTLLKGSLQTFLNAMTYPDRTCYPVASQNLQVGYTQHSHDPTNCFANWRR
jgi:Zn-dependent M16 (insulinase) family peptidase